MTASPQRTRSGRDVRILRAAVFSAVCVALAATGHALASCASVPLWAVGTGFLAVFAVAVPLAGRERSLRGIAALLAAGQSVLHVLFGLGQHGMASSAGGATASAADVSLVARAARLMCGAQASALSPEQARRILADARVGTAAEHSAHGAADALSTTAGASVPVLPSLPMLLGHVLAAVAAGWLLRRGDLALVRLVRLASAGVAEGTVLSLRGALALVRALLAGLPGVPGPGARAVRPARSPLPAPRPAALQHTVIRRGPPAAACVLAA
ncbi:hypothetical protein [Streptomyces minutiscleroticus]|uniref:Integral membrane protein n=1 Tax=Streptomyces minutiscleroticus TaxID=68238 RepID=A0A918NN23_9ACTN|nr:hypothetical protein [Streptomyces minutiscleroticus]GGX82401.1 hypothetical protein GCM10010358_40720 [Streptomyces minutiscleroticus]